MARQTFHFLTDSAVRLEFHITAFPRRVRVDTLHNPPRQPDSQTFTTLEEAVDGMTARVRFHLSETGARLALIRYRYGLAPITFAHVARYAVPVGAME